MTESEKDAPQQGAVVRGLSWFWREWVKPMLVIGFVLGSFRSAVADWNDVPTGSMKPTILEGDRVFVNKLAYDLRFPFTLKRLAQWGNPSRGEIVVFFSPADGKRLVKRVIGVPGDRVEMRNSVLFVNGARVPQQPGETALFEPRDLDGAIAAIEDLNGHRHTVLANPQRPSMQSFVPVTVPKDSYLMMGDNRDNSFDSRFFGYVPRESIVGQATGVALSVDWSQYKPRWGRFFSPLT